MGGAAQGTAAEALGQKPGTPARIPAVGPQVRTAAAATTRRGCQRGGAVYEKERESKAEEQKRSAASKAADQSTRRGGWRPVGCEELLTSSEAAGAPVTGRRRLVPDVGGE